MKILLSIILSFFPLLIIAQDGSLGKDNFLEGFSYPSFPGGETEMHKFINKRLVYPSSALEEKIEGNVHLIFTVREEGNINNIRVIRSLHPDCDSIAVNIVQSMPKWTPARQNGKNTPMNYSLPIRFQLPSEEIEGEVFTLADSMPEFPGGTDSLFSFIRKNLRWPNTEVDFQGRVVIRFVVTKEGKVRNPKIIRGVIPEADKEAIRVVRMMPDWILGRRNGEKVNVYYLIPITFRLI